MIFAISSRYFTGSGHVNSWLYEPNSKNKAFCPEISYIILSEEFKTSNTPPDKDASGITSPKVSSLVGKTKRLEHINNSLNILLSIPCS
jgi:hypothetical protein